MTWRETAERYLSVFERAREQTTEHVPAAAAPSVSGGHGIPELRIEHFLSLCDDTASSSTRSIQCPTVPTAIVSTTTLAPCCSRARLQIQVTCNCCLK